MERIVELSSIGQDDGQDDKQDDKQDVNELMTRYIFWVEGYSVLNNTGFIKFEMGAGMCEYDAVFNAYDKIKNNLSINYGWLYVDEMKITDSKIYENTTGIQPSGFIFHPLTDEIREEFREDEERHLMSCEESS